MRIELDMTVEILEGLRVKGCTLIGQEGSCCRQLAVGGIIWCRRASRQITASSAGVAPRQWPVTGFVELQGTVAVRWPSTLLTACASAASFIFVPVPCA